MTFELQSHLLASTLLLPTELWIVKELSNWSPCGFVNYQSEGKDNIFTFIL